MRTHIFKAILLNSLFFISTVLSLVAYGLLFSTSLSKLEQTKLIQLDIKDPAQLLQHSEDILATTPIINRIYLEWITETILLYFITTLLITFFHGNVLSLLYNKRCLQKKELYSFLKFSSIFCAGVFFILVWIVIITHPRVLPYVFSTLVLVFYLLLLLASSLFFCKQKHILETLTRTFVPLLTRFILTLSGIALLIFIIQKIIPLFILLTPLIIVIWSTWMTHEALVITCTKDK